MINYLCAASKKQMASVYIKNGRVWVRGTINGRQEQKSTGKEATKQNIAWVERNKAMLLQELVNKPQSENFAEYATFVLQATEARRNGRSNKDSIRKVQTLNKYFGRYQLKDIKPSMIELWQSNALKTLSPKSVLNHRSVLSMIFHYAEIDGLIDKNPLRLIKAPKKPTYRPLIYRIDEIKLILKAVDGQFRDLLRFNFFAELRSGELIALKWSKVDFERGTILIDERVLDGETNAPKGEKVRIIAMTPQAKDALLSQRMRTGLGKYVFLDEANTPYQRCDYIDRMFKKVCIKAGVKVGKFYNTRHSFATLMLEYGMSESWLIQQMGHFDIKVTREHYIGQLSSNFATLEKVVI